MSALYYADKVAYLNNYMAMLDQIPVRVAPRPPVRLTGTVFDHFAVSTDWVEWVIEEHAAIRAAPVPVPAPAPAPVPAPVIDNGPPSTILWPRYNLRPRKQRKVGE